MVGIILVRLNSTGKLKKNDCVAEDCKATRQAYVEKGYLQKVVSDKQLPNNIWYFPHLPVVSVDKMTMI